MRFAYRFILLPRSQKNNERSYGVTLIGTGTAGKMILSEMIRRALNENIVRIIDDNKNKWNRDIEGVPIVCGRKSIIDNDERYQIDNRYIL